MLLTLQVMIPCICFCSFTTHFTALDLPLCAGSVTDSGNDTRSSLPQHSAALQRVDRVSDRALQLFFFNVC